MQRRAFLAAATGLIFAPVAQVSHTHRLMTLETLYGWNTWHTVRLA